MQMEDESVILRENKNHDSLLTLACAAKSIYFDESATRTKRDSCDKN